MIVEVDVSLVDFGGDSQFELANVLCFVAGNKFPPWNRRMYESFSSLTTLTAQIEEVKMGS